MLLCQKLIFVAAVYDCRGICAPFGGRRQPLQLQRLDSIAEILLAEIQVVRVPIMHPWDFVTRRVGHEVEKEGVFIHHSRIGVEFRHLMGLVEFALRVALVDDVTHDLLVTAMVPEIRRAFFQREAIRILQDLLGPWRVLKTEDASIVRGNSFRKIFTDMERLWAR